MTYKTFLILAVTAVFYCSAQFPREQCNGVNEAAYPCGRRCEARCNAELPAFCRGIQCLGFTCRCRNGYARNPLTDKCVKVEDCPPNTCAYGESLGTCGTTCEGTCSSPFQPEICQRIDCRGSECRCDLTAGYVRNEKTGKCVKINDCPKTTNE